VDHLHAVPVMVDYIRTLKIPPSEFVVLSPDEGSIKKSLLYQQKLGGSLSVVDKRRASATVTKQEHLIGEPLEGKVAIIFDDMITTGGTVSGAAHVAKRFGARKVYACATHAVLCGPAIENLRSAPIEEIIVTDTIPIPPERMLPNMRILTVSSLLAKAIHCIHVNESISKLFQ
jgi:ribose-phosphate pyrophosphokinase